MYFIVNWWQGAPSRWDPISGQARRPPAIERLCIFIEGDVVGRRYANRNGAGIETGEENSEPIYITLIATTNDTDEFMWRIWLLLMYTEDISKMLRNLIQSATFYTCKTRIVYAYCILHSLRKAGLAKNNRLNKIMSRSDVLALKLVSINILSPDKFISVCPVSCYSGVWRGTSPTQPWTIGTSPVPGPD